MEVSYVLLYAFTAVVLLGVLYLLFRHAVTAYWRYRGTLLVTCPENKRPAAVKVDSAHAAQTAALGNPELRLRDCSRWPEREDCGQWCLRQIEAVPQDCLVKNIISRWYLDKSCILCGKDLSQNNWMEHRPGVMNAQRETFQWDEIPAESIPKVLATHHPVCWNCHVAEKFRREYPELIIDRPKEDAVRRSGLR